MSDTVPTAQLALLFPAVQPLVNAGCWPDGAAVRATDTPAAEPFVAETVTTNAASFPRWMLVCVRCTLMHRSAWAADVVGLGLVLVLPAAAFVVM